VAPPQREAAWESAIAGRASSAAARAAAAAPPLRRRPARPPSASMRAANSSFAATTISAAADGVGAAGPPPGRPAYVDLVADAEMTGTGHAAMARATGSSLKAQRSSPIPARPTMRHPRLDAPDSPSARAISAEAVSPWTRAGAITIWAF